MTIEQAYSHLYFIVLICLAVLIGITLIRSVKGPLVTDRLLAVNIICAMVIAAVLILCELLKEAYLLDVALIYALISFISVLVFASVYIRRHKAKENAASEKTAALDADPAETGEKEDGA